jgi:hypothetical protein
MRPIALSNLNDDNFCIFNGIAKIMQFGKVFIKKSPVETGL